MHNTALVQHQDLVLTCTRSGLDGTCGRDYLPRNYQPCSPYRRVHAGNIILLMCSDAIDWCRVMLCSVCVQRVILEYSFRLGEVGSSSSSRSSVCLAAWGSTSTIPGGGTDKNADEVPLDPASPVTFDPAEPVTQAPTATSDPVVSQDKQPLPESSQDSAKEALTDTPQDTVASRQDLHLPGLHRKRKEHADGKEGGEHDPKVIR